MGGIEAPPNQFVGPYQEVPVLGLKVGVKSERVSDP